MNHIQRNNNIMKKTATKSGEGCVGGVVEVGLSVPSVRVPFGSGSIEGPKHSPLSWVGKLLHSRNTGQPIPVFSSMSCAHPSRAASQRLRQGATVVLSPSSPSSPQNGK